MYDTLIVDAMIIDGSGAPWRYGDIGIRDGRIAAIGKLSHAEAGNTIAGTGLIACPGFIDIHSHADLALISGHEMDRRLLQGITTEVVGQDGLSYAPACGIRQSEWRRYLKGLNGDLPGTSWGWNQAGDYLSDLDRKASNAVYLLPHGPVRTEVMGWQARPATTGELAQMKDLVRQGMYEGAAGLSTGLTYLPCYHATTGEMIELCRPVAEKGGIYATHLRSYGPRLLEAIDEAIEIGRQSGVAVQISHLRVADPANRGLSPEILARVDQARAQGIDVTFDLYPYTSGCTPLLALLPPTAQAGGPDAILERLSDETVREQIADEMRSWNLDWSAYRLSNAPPSKLGGWEGLLVTEAALKLNIDAPLFILKLLDSLELNATIVADGGSQADNDALFAHPACMLCSDGILLGNHPHPRGYGAFPRLIADYVRDRQLLRMEDAVHKMTGLPASRLTLADRGLLRPGMAADIVVFDPLKFSDQATYDRGRLPATGIAWVFVNGQPAVAHGEYRPASSGKALRHLIH